jgi:2-keto-4-pentenoate hydratase/2-oxohepta-3-ene-1,7-dioic acid hydratase in catechol pathway
VLVAAYEQDGAERLGLVDGDEIRPFPAGVPLLDAVAGAAPEGPAAALDAVRLLPPLHPASVRDFVSFEQHVEGVEMRNKRPVSARWYASPSFLFMSPHNLVGANDPVPIPPGCTLMDFELEVAVVIGRDGRNLTPAEAADHIAGYAIFNDWSARDIQGDEMQLGLGPAKGKDFASTLGPWLVTPDELEQYRDGDRLDLGLQAWVNDVPIGDGDRLSSMAWSFEELVAYASRSAWVRAGDLIASGTCGSGALAELWGRRGGTTDPPPLAPGDVVRMTVEGIGTIENRLVGSEDELVPIPPARRRTQVA